MARPSSQKRVLVVTKSEFTVLSPLPYVSHEMLGDLYTNKQESGRCSEEGVGVCGKTQLSFDDLQKYHLHMHSAIPCWLAPPESDVRGRLLQDSQAQAAASSGSRWIQWAAAHARTRRPAVRRVYAPPYQQRARLANTTIDDGSAPKLSPSIEIGLLYVRVTPRVHLRAVSDATECIYGTSNKLLP